jgi:hypothetical protein
MHRQGSAFGLLVLLPVLLVHIVVGHVRLTFPPARYPALDFLDSVRTEPPCGVPKPPIDKGELLHCIASFVFATDVSVRYCALANFGRD